MKFLSAQPKGQTLVIILLGTSVALTVALAVSVRTISSLKQTTTSAQAQQSLAAAEAGAEVALGYLKDGTCTQANLTACNISTPVVLSGSSTQYTVVTTATGGSTDPYLMDLAKDNTQEVKLNGYTGGGTVRVCWWDPNLDGSETTNALEVIYVNDAGAMAKSAFNGVAPSPTNGFTATGGGAQVTFPSNGKKITFSRCQNITLTGNPMILRLKAFYANFSAVVDPNGGGTLPSQGYQVVATGQSADGSVKKAVRVTKSLPSLPGIFDFAIYSGSSTQPLSK